MIYVTSYRNPDIDGVACSIAYSRLLSASSKTSKAVYFGTLGLETQFVNEFCHNLPIAKKEGGYGASDEVILVDTADPDAIDPGISPDLVTEIFDHRQIVFIDRFSRAKTHIELVGSCATLITEEFLQTSTIPDATTATYLYSAIVSNTINFQNSVTTDRDKKAAQYLTDLTKLPSDYVSQMFRYKSQITSDNLTQALLQDFAVKTVKNTKIGIAQLEVTELPAFISQHASNITRFLQNQKSEKDLDQILFSGIDILNPQNYFLVPDDQSVRFFTKALGIPLTIAGNYQKGILMRKQIWPKVEAVLSLDA